MVESGQWLFPMRGDELYPDKPPLFMWMQAAAFTKTLKPLLITDHFSFGLGLCGVGGFSAHGEGSWYLKINHKNPEIGGGVLEQAYLCILSLNCWKNVSYLSSPPSAALRRG